MNKERCIELIHSEIDGTITLEEKQELHQHLESDMEMKQLFLQLMNTQAVFNQVTDVEPPLNLKSEILDAIDENRYAPSRRRNLKQFLRESLAIMPAPRYAFSFSVGLVLGAFLIVVLYYGNNNNLNNNYRFGGTILSKEALGRFRITDSLDIDIPDVSGRIEIGQTPTIVQLNLNLTSKKEIEFLIKFNPVNIHLLGFTRRSEGLNKLSSDDGLLKFFHQNTNSYTVIFGQKGQNESHMVFSIFSGGLVYSKKMIIEPLE